MKPLKIAVVGATGVVGRMFLTVLEERKIPIESLVLFASSRSIGTVLSFRGGHYVVKELNSINIEANPVDVALFSAGGEMANMYAPLFVKQGAIVIDNSSAFRMDKNTPLVVPEVNPLDIQKHHGIIANPNCSTVQAVVALKPLHDAFEMERLVISTYQAVSGAGSLGIEDLSNHAQVGQLKKFPYPIHHNVIPHIDVFMDDGYTKEEHKLIHETRKILHEPFLAITATAVRVPVLNAHSESINVTFKKPFDLKTVRALLTNAPSIQLVDDPRNLLYPMPLTVSGKDDVFVGRLRIDPSCPNTLNMFVVGDNIRKGSATNAIQIVQLLVSKLT
jgi:aspartate-semialdehyde dehydrogenase